MKDDPNTGEETAYERRRRLDVEKLIKARPSLAAPFEDKNSDRSYLYVPMQMLVAAGESEAAASHHLLRWGCRPDTKTNPILVKKGLNVRRWFCPAELPVPELVDSLRSAGGNRKITAGPNHYFGSEPRWAWGGGGAPTPVDAWDLPTPGVSGSTAHVAVLDTGVWGDTEKRHQRLYKHLTSPIDDLDFDKLDDDLDGLLDSGAGHGTFVLGILNRVAPWMRLNMQRVLGAHGLGDELTIALGISEVPPLTKIINLSFGGYTHDNLAPTGLQAALDLRSDAVFVSAAGNHSTPEVPFWPAAFPNVVAVAAVDSRDQNAIVPAGFTNRGSWVDVCAPGVDIRSTYVDGKWEDTDGFTNGWALWSGTSFAAPQVAAAIAQYRKDHGGTPQAARDAFLATLPALAGHPDMGKLYKPDPEHDPVYRGA